VEPGESTSALMTRAGTVQARRIEMREQGVAVERLWLSREVPVLGLAKMEVLGGVNLEVEGFGEANLEELAEFEGGDTEAAPWPRSMPELSSWLIPPLP
jgi:hypothetical protein